MLIMIEESQCLLFLIQMEFITLSLPPLPALLWQLLFNIKSHFTWQAHNLPVWDTNSVSVFTMLGSLNYAWVTEDLESGVL